MRKVVVSTVVGALVLLGGTACDTTEGSGNVVTHAFELAPFSILEVGDSFVVNVTVGDTPSATVRIDDNLDDVLDVAVLDDVLTIGLDPDTDVVDATLEADVTVTGLEELGIAGASIVTLSDPLEAGTLALTISGASQLSGAVQVDQGRWELSGASLATLSGSASELDVTLSGASLLTAPDLSIEDLEIDASGASTAEVTVTGTLSAGASGASSIRYGGSPTVTRSESSGASSIEARG